MSKLWFIAGLAAGYVLGTKAGRTRYEQLVDTARKVRENPTVNNVAGIVQSQAEDIYQTAKEKIESSPIADKVTNIINEKKRKLQSTAEKEATAVDPLTGLGATGTGHHNI